MSKRIDVWINEFGKRNDWIDKSHFAIHYFGPMGAGHAGSWFFRFFIFNTIICFAPVKPDVSVFTLPENYYQGFAGIIG